ncbi:MAG: response regulator [Burkholderiales bacterium]
MSVAQPTVFIVDDDAGVRDSLALLLELHGYRTRASGSAEAFLAGLDPNSSGCAIVDLRMPGMDGAALQDELHRRGSTMPVIIITAHGDVSAARTTLKAGAVDFIEKPIDDVQLLAAIRLALGRDAEHRGEQAQAAELEARIGRLTARERQVMDLVVSGRHNREIAAELGISPRTVEVYKSHLMEKLRVRRIPDLVRLVLAARPKGTR